MKDLVITDQAAEHLVGSAYSVQELTATSPSLGILRRKTIDGATLIASGRERTNFKYAVIDADEFRKLPPETMRHALPRIDRTLKATARFPLRLPLAWSEYHSGNKVAFFALPKELKSGYRWIVEYDAADDRVLFRKITAPGTEIQLDAYEEKPPRSYRADLAELVAAAKQGLSAYPTQETTLVDTFDFNVVGAAAISRNLRLEEWVSSFTAGQRQLYEMPFQSSARVIGPAGSGKTLALCARAVRETREARKGHRSIRILFATHSWAMAERVDQLLTTLNGGASVEEIVVFPLMQVLKEVLADTYAGSLSILGDDSSEGRQLQLELLSDVVAAVSATDLAVFARHGLHQDIANAIASGGIDKLDLLENLWEEFNGVLLAENVVPGEQQAEERYLTAQRDEHMPPFSSRGDRMFVLAAYREYLQRLKEWGAITIDQLVNDAIRVLETFSWSVRRDVEGYDEIFVDELQLFDSQERLALTLLGRVPSATAFVTAEDPSQGVFSAISAQWRRDLAVSSARPSVELAAVHRFNEAMLRFVRHLYMSFPLNALSMKVEAGGGAGGGRIPTIRMLTDEAALIRAVQSSVEALSDGMGADERLAVITLDSSSSDIAAQLKKRRNVVFIGGFDDVEQLTYARRAIVVGSWQFMGGTQFSRVIVAARRLGAGRHAFGRMRELIALYVAASRASNTLEIVAAGSLTPELKTAVEAGVLEAAI